ncbi:MAG: cyclic nucleotide-binding domain-containing protein, partial [Cyclobacteriaceae bacterium]|nr:cyclic nucleotide-binding domain-containing protein [Cyclobacteriaceae bacterium]
SNILFHGLSGQHLQLIAPHVYEMEYKKGEVIIKEGDAGTFMFMIDDGSFSVFKDELKLSEGLSGDYVGLMALVDTHPRSATVIAGENGASGYCISKKGFNQIIDEEKTSAVSTLLLNYLKHQHNKIRSTNELSLQEARARLVQEKKRVLSARFFVQMVMGLVIYTFFLRFLSEVANQGESTYISFIILAIYGIWSYLFVRNSKLPLASFGLTMSNFRPAIKLAMKATFIFIALLFLLKWLMITISPEQFGTQLIELYSQKDAQMPVWIILILYSTHSVIQEFIARGCIQGGLLQFIDGKLSAWTAIILATLMFSSFHIMLNVQFAFITIIPGLFWGYLFYKKRNFLAVSISHILIGVVALFVLNIVN